jgi:hypothetical protein
MINPAMTRGGANPAAIVTLPAMEIATMVAAIGALMRRAVKRRV